MTAASASDPCPLPSLVLLEDAGDVVNFGVEAADWSSLGEDAEAMREAYGTPRPDWVKHDPFQVLAYAAAEGVAPPLPPPEGGSGS